MGIKNEIIKIVAFQGQGMFNLKINPIVIHKYIDI